MWFSMTLWTVLASLICSTIASSHYSSSNSYPDYERIASREFLDPRWNNEYDQERTMDLSPWSADPETFSPQVLDGKSPDLADTLMVNLDEQDLPNKKKRESHSLSIVNPLDVLRQRLMLEMARRRMKENQNQIKQNAAILKNLGKRSVDNMKDARTNIRRISQVSNSGQFQV